MKRATSGLGAPVIAAGLLCVARRQCDCHSGPTRECSTAAAPAVWSTSANTCPSRSFPVQTGRRVRRDCPTNALAAIATCHFSIARDGRRVVPAGRRSRPRLAVHRHVRSSTRSPGNPRGEDGATRLTDDMLVCDDIVTNQERTLVGGMTHLAPSTVCCCTGRGRLPRALPSAHPDAPGPTRGPHAAGAT